MNGFCNWVEVLLTEDNIAEELVEGKLSRLIEAMKKLFGFLSCSLKGRHVYIQTNVYLPLQQMMFKVYIQKLGQVPKCGKMAQ